MGPRGRDRTQGDDRAEGRRDVVRAEGLVDARPEGADRAANPAAGLAALGREVAATAYPARHAAAAVRRDPDREGAGQRAAEEASDGHREAASTSEDQREGDRTVGGPKDVGRGLDQRVAWDRDLQADHPTGCRRGCSRTGLQ
ncbi:hypothetical protein A3K89_11155 [Rhodococcoides kyotonense]|uniref:Uncharacterized protein n=1 Tax=Rhodococcoides kyotonense TaxID=398843 RepID=A0A177Y7L2_9NOCA|nr:hypothetical protein A3K89_11155 [Rhodococcus kyotonensis]